MQALGIAGIIWMHARFISDFNIAKTKYPYPYQNIYYVTMSIKHDLIC